MFLQILAFLYSDLFLSFLWPQTLLFEYLQLLFYTLLISSKTPCSILLGHVTLHFILHFHQAVFPQITICLIVYCCCSVAKLCLTLCDAMDCRPPGSSVCEISQARIREWVIIPSPYLDLSPLLKSHGKYAQMYLIEVHLLELSSPWILQYPSP